MDFKKVIRKMKTGGKMKRSHFLLFTFCCLLFIVFLGGCGSGPGSPGSSGTENTGIAPRVLSVTHSDPSADQGDIWEIDFIGDICSDGKPEKFGNDYAHITFHGDQLNPNVTSDNILFITNYKVTFLKIGPDSPTIPQIPGSSQAGIEILPGADTGPFSFLIFDTSMKDGLQQALSNNINNPAFFPLLYNMKIEMQGQDRFGNDFTVEPIERVVSIKNWNHCP